MKKVISLVGLMVLSDLSNLHAMSLYSMFRLAQDPEYSAWRSIPEISEDRINQMAGNARKHICSLEVSSDCTIEEMKNQMDEIITDNVGFSDVKAKVRSKIPEAVLIDQAHNVLNEFKEIKNVLDEYQKPNNPWGVSEKNLTCLLMRTVVDNANKPMEIRKFIFTNQKDTLKAYETDLQRLIKVFEVNEKLASLHSFYSTIDTFAAKQAFVQLCKIQLEPFYNDIGNLLNIVLNQKVKTAEKLKSYYEAAEKELKLIAILNDEGKQFDASNAAKEIIGEGDNEILKQTYLVIDQVMGNSVDSYRKNWEELKREIVNTTDYFNKEFPSWEQEGPAKIAEKVAEIRKEKMGQMNRGFGQLLGDVMSWSKIIESAMQEGVVNTEILEILKSKIKNRIEKNNELRIQSQQLIDLLRSNRGQYVFGC